MSQPRNAQTATSNTKPKRAVSESVQYAIDLLIRSLDKPKHERDISLPVVKQKVIDELSAAENEARQAAKAIRDDTANLVLHVFDDAVVDAIAVPGAPSRFAGKSIQDVLAIMREDLRKKVQRYAA